MSRQPSAARSASGNTHIAGELFVAAELAKRGYQVALTMGNAKAVDLFVEKDGKAICVQVKAIAKRQSYSWVMPGRINKIIDGVIYVCVVLNPVGEPPSYFVVPPVAVRLHTVFYRNRGALDIAKLRNAGFEDRWELVEQALQPGANLRVRPLPAA
jgi:hypothetical protein